MKIGFFSDTHIDYSVGTRHYTADGVNLRMNDGFNALTNTITAMIEEEVDYVIHGGDLFHGSIPSVRGIYHVRRELERLHQAGIPFVGISGNHDYPNTRLRLPAVDAVHDPDRTTTIITDPSRRIEIADGIILHAVSHAGLLGTPQQPAPENGNVNILVSHGSAAVDGYAAFHCVDSPAEAVITHDTLAQDFNLTLLGHYHSQTKLNAIPGCINQIYYAGSGIRRGFSDDEGDRGWLLVTINPDGTIETRRRKIHQRAQHDLAVISAKGLTGEDVQERILANIASIDFSQTPIVRQRVVDCPLPIRRGVDTQMITEKTSDALTWQLNFTKPIETDILVDDETIKTRKALTLTEGWGKFIEEDTGLTKAQRAEILKRGKALLEGADK